MPNFKRIYSSFRNSLRHKKVDQQNLQEPIHDEEQIKPEKIPLLRRKFKQNSSSDDGYCSARTSLYSSTLTSPSSGESPTSSSNSSSNSGKHPKPKLSSMSTKNMSSSFTSLPPLSPTVLSPSVLLDDCISLQNSILSPVTSIRSSLNASSYEDTILRSSSSSGSSTFSFKRNSYKKFDRMVMSSSELLEDEVFADIIEQLEDLDQSELCQTEYNEKMNKGNYEVIKEALDDKGKCDECFENGSKKSNNSMKQLLARRLQRLTALLRLFP